MTQLHDYEIKLKKERYKANQQARYNDDYTSIMKRATKLMAAG
jgi:hypothetical protein